MTKIREKWQRKRKKISGQEDEEEREKKEEEKVGSRIRRRLSAN